MSKESPANYYQNNKDRLQKKLVKDFKVFLKKKKKKSINMVLNNTKICQKMKNQNWLNSGKNIVNEKIHLIIIIRTYFSFRRFFFS